MAPTDSPPDDSGTDCGSGHALKLEIRTDHFAAETFWRLFDASGNEKLEGGNDYINSRLHYETHCIEDGKHTLIIYDTFQDGFCCALGPGKEKIGSASSVSFHFFNSLRFVALLSISFRLLQDLVRWTIGSR